MISGIDSRRKGWLSTQSKKRGPGGEGMFTPSASAGHKGCLTPQAEQGCEVHSLEIPSQTVAAGLSIKPKNNTEAGVFLFRGQNLLEKHFQELLQEQETGRSLGKPQASTSEAKGSALTGAAPRPHHQISQGMWLRVLAFPKKRNKSRNSLLGPCLYAEDQEVGMSLKGM